MNIIKKKRSIVLTGGGTAGHVWPHFALFEAENSKLVQEYVLGSVDVHYVGSSAGMEKNLVETNCPQWNYHSISTGKLRRYFSIKNFLDPFRIFWGFVQSFFLLRKIKASLVFSKGGFVSVPVVWAAWLRGIPVVIHESDVTPALATKLTLPFAFIALVSFGETAGKLPPFFRSRIQEVGLPIRKSLFLAKKDDALSYFSLLPSKKTILIFGGSLGAQSLNQKIFEIVPELDKQYNIIHIVGKGNARKIEGTQNYKQFEFLNQDMKYAYAVADLAICRAGASSIFELAAARVPMVLVPLGLHASRGDQIVNANIFTSKGWAQTIDENNFQKENALQLIYETMSSLDERKKALNSAPSVNSAKNVADILWEIIVRYEGN